MPSKNIVKQFAPNQMWHVYNRGVEKRKIFLDERDYKVFLSFLKIALGPEIPEEATYLEISKVINLRRLHLYNQVELASYCLMPNHFHLLLYQYDERGVSNLMRSIATGYVMYFNKRYNREGRLFQNTYKASHIDSDSYWSHISRYIHLNPPVAVYKDYPCSSYGYFMGSKKAEWIHPEWIMRDFDGPKEYEKFTDDYIEYKRELDDLKKVLAD